MVPLYFIIILHKTLFLKITDVTIPIFVILFI